MNFILKTQKDSPVQEHKHQPTWWQTWVPWVQLSRWPSTRWDTRVSSPTERQRHLLLGWSSCWSFVMLWTVSKYLRKKLMAILLIFKIDFFLSLQLIIFYCSFLHTLYCYNWLKQTAHIRIIRLDKFWHRFICDIIATINVVNIPITPKHANYPQKFPLALYNPSTVPLADPSLSLTTTGLLSVTVD